MSYKHKPSAVYKETEAKRSSGLASLLWMFVGALIAVMIAVFVYLSPLFDGFRNTVVIEPETPVVPIEQPSEPAPEYEFYDILPQQEFSSVPQGVSVQEQVGGVSEGVPVDAVVRGSDNAQEPAETMQIDIVEEDATYDDANDGTDNDGANRQEVSNAQAAAPQSSQPSQKAEKSTPATTFILQIRSYESAEEADRKRAEVLMAGVDAVVVRRSDQNSTIYQVVSVPMTSRSEASAAMSRLRDNGIDALVVEQRRK
ncbi:hypothetical protein B0181_03215 [Moraxella caviae]|uniref:Cell division protein FtsN n=1 Tax=Moraxella caviae TaxID=34060 RepID=A0A1T0A6V8_9GAMM|nr:SPOR domain-containing protein [Moraxella caviae]OOR91328.1 hypothetical protein B0181_03215 [Moraxella caviae]STZ13936.1 cell division protein FtsN [Moraxella caviae]VEW11128.1 cell division protein FtsN [Moraxella caviae]